MKFDLTSVNINYLKITYKDRNSFAHCIKAAVRYINDFEIVSSVKIDNKSDIDTSQEIELSIVCDNGLYKAKTNLIKVAKEEPYVLFSMAIPHDIEFQQKREFFRVKLQENANIIYEENEQVKQIPVITYDISANGVRVELDKKISFSEKVKVILYLPAKTIELKAKYIRTDEEEDLIKASFKFENISQQDLDYISQVCFQKQIEERRKNLL